MKTVLLDGDLILRGLTDEGDFHQHFVVLWQTLQSSKLEGYITKLDLARLHRRLNHEIGQEASERLLTAFRRILKIWSSHPSGWIDAIITENPQSFNEWDIPTFSVSEFLQRYELDALLKQTSEAIPPLTKPPELPSSHKINKAATTVLLMLPILLELWMRREQVTGVLAALNQQETEQEAEEPLKSGLATHSSDVISVVQRPEAMPTADVRSPSARLLLSDLPGLDISVENDVSLDVQLDSQGNAVIIQLQLPQNASSTQDAIAATLYRTDNNQAIAQIVMTESGLVVLANPSHVVSRSASEFDSTDGQVIAIVQHTSDGHLTAWLNAQTSPLTGRSPEATLFTQNTVVAVRSVDRFPSFLPAPEQRRLEIRVDVKPDGNHTVTIDPGLMPTPRLENTTPGLGGGGGIESPGEPFPNFQPNQVENYDNSWVLNNNGNHNGNNSNFLPGNLPSPSPSEPGQNSHEGRNGSSGGTAPDRPSGLFLEPFVAPDVAVTQVVDSTSASQVDGFYSSSLAIQDDLLGNQGQAMVTPIPDELLTGSISVPMADSHSTLTISIRNWGEIGAGSPLQSTSIRGTGVISSAVFPNDSTPSFYPWLSTPEISSI
ncbi:MAG: hypothetical protein SFY66_11420 [Oculatellaceae cyanobacterium bins.114]|nr:hypothetical protein [Oculatellaceae cyanobacterium bins.114]